LRIESICEKHFPSDIPIVDAVAFPKDNRTKLLAGVLLGGFFAYILTGMLVQKSPNAGFLYFFTAIALVISLVMILSGFKDTFVAIRRRRQLEHRGERVKATVVGRESDLNADPELYWIYYQFHPDFVARHQDETQDRYFFQLPIGHTLEVLYLPESPQVTGVMGRGRRDQ
jgi:hypothetical protein